MASGIYCIENIINGKKYIGQAIDLFRRKQEHFSHLERNSHHNSHLQRAYNKHEKTCFIFKILLYCEIFELTKYEQFFVNLYTPELLYNNRLDCINSNLGIKHTEETKEKMRKSSIGKNKGKAPWIKGKHLSYKHKKRISESEKGKILSEETKEKMRKSNYGRKEKNSSSKFFGIYLQSKKYWYSQVRIDNKTIYIGCFKNELDAAIAYDKYVIENNIKKPLNFKRK